jgi:hypothetical protein
MSTKDSTWEVECCDNPHNSKGIPDLIVNPQPQLSMSILLSIHNFPQIQQIALVKDPKEENYSKKTSYKYQNFSILLSLNSAA